MGDYILFDHSEFLIYDQNGKLDEATSNEEKVQEHAIKVLTFAKQITTQTDESLQESFLNPDQDNDELPKYGNKGKAASKN